MINGKEKCEKEGNDLVLTCPNFALDMMRKQKIKNMIARSIQTNEMKSALSVPSYNEGRSIKDVDGSKTKIHGTRKYLRPDTMWADERYVNVN